MTRNEIKEKEIEFLAKEYKKNPQLFRKETFNETPEFLERFGIFIKNKNSFPLGYIKFWPQDFIVEEIAKGNEMQTIEVENFFDQKKEFSEKDPTIYATLVKCGLSTIETIQDLASFLNSKAIQFAGIKDKDALTSQLISFRRTKIEELQKINSPYFFLKNIYSGKGVVEIGSLKENKFTILIRINKFFQRESFLKILRNIKKEGFLNYFYLQRFGTPRLINFYWGLFILKGDYQKVILNFLCSPGQRELPYFQKFREEIKKEIGNWKKIEKILEPFPLIFRNEKKIVNYLKSNPRDFIGALNQIPEQVQLWLFALGSLLFNKKVSEYLKRGEKMPKTLPLILSNDKRDWLPYKSILEENGIHLLPFQNLKPFPYIQWRKREIKTTEKVKILNYKIIPEGVILDFILPKAAYATTFLAHLFNLSSGLPPKDISTYSIDTKATLGKGSLEKVLNQFGEVIYPKTEDFIKKFAQE